MIHMVILYLQKRILQTLFTFCFNLLKCFWFDLTKTNLNKLTTKQNNITTTNRGVLRQYTNKRDILGLDYSINTLILNFVSLYFFPLFWQMESLYGVAAILICLSAANGQIGLGQDFSREFV